MPAAIPIAATAGSAILGDVLQNGQNKSNQKNADNQSASARQFDAQALQTALNNYASYLSANPSPASQYGNIKAPQSVYGGQSTINSPTTSVPGMGGTGGSGGGLSSSGLGSGGPQQVQQLLAMLMKQGAQTQQQAQQFTPGSLQTALNVGGNMNGTPQGQVGGRRIPLPQNVAARVNG